MSDTYKKANVVVFNFEMAPENLPELEKKLKAENQISRYLILAKDTKKALRTYQKAQLSEKPKQKVEIGEIEKKLEELLGQ